jgi:hypothetical protein
MAGIGNQLHSLHCSPCSPTVILPLPSRPNYINWLSLWFFDVSYVTPYLRNKPNSELPYIIMMEIWCHLCTCSSNKNTILKIHWWSNLHFNLMAKNLCIIPGYQRKEHLPPATNTWTHEMNKYWPYKNLSP